MNTLFLMIPLATILLIFLFRSFNFKTTQGLFLLGGIAFTLITYYSPYKNAVIWLPIVTILLAEIVVNILVGLKGKQLNEKFYSYLLVGIGLFPWWISLWGSITYASFMAVGFIAGWLSRRNSITSTYAPDLSGIIVGLIVATLIMQA